MTCLFTKPPATGIMVAAPDVSVVAASLSMLISKSSRLSSSVFEASYTQFQRVANVGAKPPSTKDISIASVEVHPLFNCGEVLNGCSYGSRLA